MTSSRAERIATAAHEHALTVWSAGTGADVAAPEYRRALDTAVKRALSWVGGRSMRIQWPSYRTFKTTDDMIIPWAQAVSDWELGCYDFGASANALPAGREAPAWGSPRQHVAYVGDDDDMIEPEWHEILPGSVAFAGFEPPAAVAENEQYYAPISATCEAPAAEPRTGGRLDTSGLVKAHLRGKHNYADVDGCRMCRRHPTGRGAR